MSAVHELNAPVRTDKELLLLCQEMRYYNKHLARIYYCYFVECKGFASVPKMRQYLLDHGEKPTSEGGWVSSGRHLHRLLNEAHNLAVRLHNARTNPAQSVTRPSYSS